MTGGKRVAALSVITLGAAYEFAISLDRLSNNPTKGVERFQTVRRERYLSEREFAALAEALTEFERSPFFADGGTRRAPQTPAEGIIQATFRRPYSLASGFFQP